MTRAVDPRPSQTEVPASAAALLAGIVDYAGLFPPAGLELPDAAAEYSAALAGDDAWMLGRFVLQGARLPELAWLRANALRVSPGVESETWSVSAIVGPGGDELDSRLAGLGDDARLRVDSVECKTVNLEGLGPLADRYAGAADVYVEVLPADASAWMPRLASLGLRAKLRTGGVVADAFPPPAAVIGFIAAALQHNVAFKATAGLHHPVRGTYRLTYDANPSSAPMYGYLNVLLATAALHAGASHSVAEALLLRDHTSDLEFADEGLRWGNDEFAIPVVQAVRSTRFISFGSCSFREPVGELLPLLAAER